MTPPKLHTAAFYASMALTLLGVIVSLTGANIPSNVQNDIAQVIGWLLGSTGIVNAVYHLTNKATAATEKPPAPPGMSA